MKNLFAAASYSFNNFYNNLNTQGQMVFTTIIFLIVLLCAILLFTYIVQEIKLKAKIRKVKEEKKKNVNINEISKSNDEKSLKKEEYNPEDKTEMLSFENVKNSQATKESKSEIEEIKDKISNAINEQKPIDLTNFEEDQEKTAIISIDELYKKAKELEIIDDDNGNVNYLEKYNLEPAEVSVSEKTQEEPKKEVKAFKVSQVISPIYGVKKEVINENKK